MADQSREFIRLGLFVTIGLASLIFLLYFIGSRQQLFSSAFPLEAVFRNVNGLKKGNNVRLAGIDIGTVRQITMLSDTAVLVKFQIRKSFAGFIQEDATATVGTDGLMGNRIIIISPGNGKSLGVSENFRLRSKEALDIDAMMRTLDITNRNFAAMSEDMATAMKRIAHSLTLWEALEDKSLPLKISSTLSHIESTSQKANQLASMVTNVITDIAQSNKGIVPLMKDSTLHNDLRVAAQQIRDLTTQANTLKNTLENTISGIEKDFLSGGGVLQAAIRDTILTGKINASVDNIQKGTAAFDQNMEALKSHFLFRGYFKRQEKKAQKEKQ